MLKETIGSSILYCGDSREVVEVVKADCVLTDPPYGVNLGEVSNGQARAKNQKKYDTFSDTRDYLIKSVIPIVTACIDKFKRCAITTGNRNMWDYPQPDDMGAWWNPAGTSRGKWGFQLMVSPILYYGLDPYRGKKSYPSSPHNIGASSERKHVDHPCPKPLSIMRWLVNRVATEGEVVFDPFMGSGSTGVACVELNRFFVGCEISQKYFSEACRRMERAHQQPNVFGIQKPEQNEIFKESTC